MIDKKKVQEYLKKLQKADELKQEIDALKAEFEAHVKESGETTLCNLLEVNFPKNPPKLVATEGGNLNAETRAKLTVSLKDTEFVKTTDTLELKKMFEAQTTDKTVKKALKTLKLTIEQTERIEFGKIVSPTAKSKKKDK